MIGCGLLLLLGLLVPDVIAYKAVKGVKKFGEGIEKGAKKLQTVNETYGVTLLPDSPITANDLQNWLQVRSQLPTIRFYDLENSSSVTEAYNITKALFTGAPETLKNFADALETAAMSSLDYARMTQCVVSALDSQVTRERTSLSELLQAYQKIGSHVGQTVYDLSRLESSPRPTDDQIEQTLNLIDRNKAKVLETMGVFNIDMFVLQFSMTAAQTPSTAPADAQLTTSTQPATTP